MSDYNSYIENVFRDYYSLLCNYSLNILINEDPEIVEDIVQECFVKLLEKKIELESEEHIKNYLYIAVKNESLKYLQKKKIKNQYDELFKQSYNLDTYVTETKMSINNSINVLDYLKQLPPQCSKILKRSYIDGYKNEDIATELGLSINTIRAQKMRGKSLLKILVKKFF